MTDANDLVGWLRAQLDKDAAVIEAVPTLMPWRFSDDDIDDAARPFLAARLDIGQAMAEVDAKRLILAEYERYAAERRRAMNGWESSREISPVLAALALPYADRDGYRPEWRPQ